VSWHSSVRLSLEFSHFCWRDPSQLGVFQQLDRFGNVLDRLAEKALDVDADGLFRVRVDHDVELVRNMYADRAAATPEEVDEQRVAAEIEAPSTFSGSISSGRMGFG
jgi:hypothetical protein